VNHNGVENTVTSVVKTVSTVYVHLILVVHMVVCQENMEITVTTNALEIVLLVNNIQDIAEFVKPILPDTIAHKTVTIVSILLKVIQFHMVAHVSLDYMA